MVSGKRRRRSSGRKKGKRAFRNALHGICRRGIGNGRAAHRCSSAPCGQSTLTPQLARTHTGSHCPLQLLRGLGQVMAAGLAAGRDQLRAAVIAAPAMHALRICARHALLPGTVQVQRFATQAHNPSRVRHHPGTVAERGCPEILHHTSSPGPTAAKASGRALIRKSFDL